MRKCIIILLLIIVLSACSSQPKWARHELYFGRSSDNGKEIISNEDWDAFLEENIVPAFPDGFTIIDAKGYWKGDGKTYQEPSTILMVVAINDIKTDNKVKDIASAYAKRFDQGSVLHIKRSAKVAFLGAN